MIAAETIAGNSVHPLDQDAVPGATFCHPQVASFGLTEAAGEGTGPRRQGRQVPARRRRRGNGLRRPRGDRQDRRRPQVRRDRRRPHRRQRRLRHDRGAGQRPRARGRLPGRRAHHPPAPDDLRGRPRGRPRGRRVGDPPIAISRHVFYFDLGSPYAYLAAERVNALFVEATGEPPEWQPILLGGLFKRFERGSWAETPARRRGHRRGRAARGRVRAAGDPLARPLARQHAVRDARARRSRSSRGERSPSRSRRSGRRSPLGATSPSPTTC